MNELCGVMCVVEMIRSSFAPFDRYVRSEQANIATRSSKLTSILDDLRRSRTDDSQ